MMFSMVVKKVVYGITFARPSFVPLPQPWHGRGDGGCWDGGDGKMVKSWLDRIMKLTPCPTGKSHQLVGWISP